MGDCRSVKQYIEGDGWERIGGEKPKIEHDTSKQEDITEKKPTLNTQIDEKAQEAKKTSKQR